MMSYLYLNSIKYNYKNIGGENWGKFCEKLDESRIAIDIK